MTVILRKAKYFTLYYSHTKCNVVVTHEPSTTTYCHQQEKSLKRFMSGNQWNVILYLIISIGSNKKWPFCSWKLIELCFSYFISQHLGFFLLNYVCGTLKGIMSQHNFNIFTMRFNKWRRKLPWTQKKEVCRLL